MDSQKKKFEPDLHNEQLMHALKFTSKDLDANRDGWMTEGQQKKIRKSQFEDAVFIMVTMLTCMGILFLMMSINRSVTSAQCWAMMALIVPVMLGLFYYQHMTLEILKPGKVAILHGLVVLESATRIRACHKSFSVTSEVYSAFADGEVYTLYYVPDIDTVVSAEHHASETQNLKARRGRNMQKREPSIPSPAIGYWPINTRASPLPPQSKTPRKASFKHGAERVTHNKPLPKHQTPSRSSSMPRMPRPRTKS